MHSHCELFWSLFNQTMTPGELWKCLCVDRGSECKRCPCLNQIDIWWLIWAAHEGQFALYIRNRFSRRDIGIWITQNTLKPRQHRLRRLCCMAVNQVWKPKMNAWWCMCLAWHVFGVQWKIRCNLLFARKIDSCFARTLSCQFGRGKRKKN